MTESLKKIGVFGLLFLIVMFFYTCPFRMFIGIPCPGCGMSRALSCLLQGDLEASLYYHAMLLPTMAAALAFLTVKKSYQTKVLWIWASLMLLYYLFRMLFVFPQDPMSLNHNALLFRILPVLTNL